MTWNEIAVRYPEFVQWAVATQGPLPDGDVREEDFDRLAAAWLTGEAAPVVIPDNRTTTEG